MNQFSKDKLLIKHSIYLYTFLSFVLPLVLSFVYGRPDIYQSYPLSSLLFALVLVPVQMRFLIFLVNINLTSRIARLFISFPGLSLKSFSIAYSLILILAISLALYYGIPSYEFLSSRYTGNGGPFANVIFSISALASICSTMYFITLYSPGISSSYSLIVRGPLFLSFIFQLLTTSGIASSVRCVFVLIIATFPHLVVRFLYIPFNKISILIKPRLRLTVLLAISSLLLAIVISSSMLIRYGALVKYSGSINNVDQGFILFDSEENSLTQYTVSRVSTAYYSIVHSLNPANPIYQSYSIYRSLSSNLNYRFGTVFIQGLTRKALPTPDGLNALAIGSYDVNPYKEGTSPGVYAFNFYYLFSNPFLYPFVFFCFTIFFIITASVLIVHSYKSGVASQAPAVSLIVFVYARMFAALFLASPSSLMLLFDDTLVILIFTVFFVCLLPSRDHSSASLCIKPKE